MRILILSDIHANLTALETVLSDAGDIDACWCLGDLVGYGPDPNQCIERIRMLPNLVCILGNHDAAAMGRIDTSSFNSEARQAIRWTQDELTESSRLFLDSLPEKTTVDNVTLSHGSPRHPVWEYLLDTRTAKKNFEYFDTPYCFVGHTHLPVCFLLNEENETARLIIPEPNTKMTITPRAIINPGSAGQPRDRDPRAAYAIYNLEDSTWDYRRIAYDIAAVQERMYQAGLPARHAQRLETGW
ncbi:MAG: metallophosphoesterase family protein [Anaerolineales bacterium]|jgi:predicted phosphodiesterase